MFKIYEYLSNWLREEHLRNDFLVEYFFAVWGDFLVWSDYLLVFWQVGWVL